MQSVRLLMFLLFWQVFRIYVAHIELWHSLMVGPQALKELMTFYKMQLCKALLEARL